MHALKDSSVEAESVWTQTACGRLTWRAPSHTFTSGSCLIREKVIYTWFKMSLVQISVDTIRYEHRGRRLEFKNFEKLEIWMISTMEIKERWYSWAGVTEYVTAQGTDVSLLQEKITGRLGIAGLTVLQ